MNTNIIAILIVSVSTNWTTIKHHEGKDIQAGLVETNYSVQVELNGKQVAMDAGKAYADELLTRRIDQVNQNFFFTNNINNWQWIPTTNNAGQIIWEFK